MRVLLIGATGNLGLRCIPALLSHNHTVIAYVRNPDKLKSLLQPELSSAIQIVEGDAYDADAISRALLENKCNAVVHTAGGPVLNPWGKAILPDMCEAVSKAACEVAKETKEPIRAWFIAGMSLLDYPDSTYFLADFVPVGREHITTMKMLQATPRKYLDWSILCPSVMRPEIATEDLKPLDTPRKHSLIIGSDVSPGWSNQTWYSYIPIFGRFLNTFISVLKNGTSLEDCADFMAEDLAKGDEKWSYKRVGIKEKTIG